MKLTAVPATETTPNTINILTDKGLKFASVDQLKRIKVFEEGYLEVAEARDILKISDNFDLFFQNIKNS